MPEVLVVGLSGSPRKASNTDLMLDEALGAARAVGACTELIRVTPLLRALKMPFCVHCSDSCEGKCYRGSALEAVLERVGAADGLIVGTPVYFGTVAGELKAFWDFTRQLRASQALADVPGGVVVVAQCRFGGQETTIRAVQDMMLIHGMLVVGDSVYGVSHGQHGAAAQEPAAEDGWGRERARVLGQHVAELAAALADYRRAKRLSPPAVELPTASTGSDGEAAGSREVHI